MAKEITITEMKHSELGPSASERWLNCPGSVLLIRGLDRPDSIYAAEGNAAHDLSEWCRVKGVDASFYEGTTIKVGEFEFEVDREMIDAVNEFVEYVEQWPGDPLVEEMVEYEPWVPGGFGTLDDARLDDKLVRVTDLKYGKGVQVWADGNPQLLLYGLGLYNDYSHLYEFDRFILGVHQPRLDHVDSFEVSVDELLRWADEKVKPIAKQALEPGAPIVAGDHCRFCPAKATCKVRAEYVAREVFEDFTDLDSGERDLAFMTNDEIALALPKLSTIKSWCNDLEKHAVIEIQKGGAFLHPESGKFKLVAGRSNRIWRPGVEDEFDGDDRLWDKKFKSPAQAEKVVGKGTLDEWIDKPPGAPKLAPGTDKRPSLEIKAEDEFGDLGDG